VLITRLKTDVYLNCA